MGWKYYNPTFEYENEFDDAGWPWVGHRYFAYDLICNIQPMVIVELGTHKGTSFFSFCQAAKDKKIPAKIFAVDTWEGDDQAGFYGEDIYKSVRSIMKNYYSGVQTKLLRMKFDEAVSKFEDNSIDILHIDGLHTYEAVKHDFDNWINKVSDNGILLLHDIAVTKDDFGVYKLWEELKKKYPNVGFNHSFGLGVIYKGGKYYMGGQEEEWRAHYSYLHDEIRSAIINTFEQRLEEKEKETKLINAELNQKNQENLGKEKEIRQKNQEIRQKEQEINFMKLSKFWKLRGLYVSVMKKLGLR